MRKICILSLSLLLSVLFSFTNSFAQQCTVVGWASQNGGVTGGGTATPVVVSNYTDLKAAILSSTVKVVHISGTITIPSAGRISFQDQTGKTIYGLPGSKLVSNDLSKDGSGIMYMKRCTSVILKNITFEGPGAYDTDGWDNITIDNSTNIWIDHCEFRDGMDGNLDIKNAADYITVTWCKFIYNKAPIPGGSGGSNDHRFSNLFGSSDGATADRGHLRITMQNNWWAQGCKERMPRVRFGKVHLVNNLFNSTVANKCAMAGFEADLLVESNVFENVNSPIDKMDNTYTAITSRNNIFTNTTGNTTGSGTAFTPPYSITITPAANVKSDVMAGAGATLNSPTCGPPPVTYSLSTTAIPTAGGSVSGAGTYNSGSMVTVTATPATGYTFTGWSGDASGTNPSVSVTMNGNKSVTANFEVSTIATYTLATNVSPAGGGSVTRNPNASSYNDGTSVTLTAVPAAGYNFTGWSGDASGTNSSVSITMNSNKTVTANFVVQPPGGTSTIRIEDDATTATGLCQYDGSIGSNSGANNGKVINLSNSAAKIIEWSVAAPASGTYTLNWRYVNSSGSNAFSMKLLVNGVTIDAAQPFPQTANSTTFGNATKAVTLTAGNNKIRLETTASAATADIDWIEITGDAPSASNCSGTTVSYTLTTTASPSAGGTVSGAGTYTSGTVVTLTATPASGYTFTGWSGDASGTNTSVTVTMSSNKSVIANFSAITYTLNTTASPSAGGTISGAGTYNSGTVVTLTATPASGYEFTGWSGDASGTNTSVAVTMNTNKSVTANFALITYTLSTTAAPSAGGTVTGAGTYDPGTVVTLTASPASGYTFTGWSGDASGTNTSVTVTMDGDRSVTANFAPVTYTLSTTAVPSAGGTVSGAGTYNSGTVVTLTATPASGYAFTGWSGDASDTNTSVTVTMDNNKSITANFALITYTLSTTASPTAGGTVSGAGTYNSGTVVTLTATPASGYNFTGWSGDASGTNTSVTVTMSSNKSVTANFQLQGGGTATIRIEDNATTAQGLCGYEGSISSNSGASNGKVINLSNSIAKGADWKVNVPAAGSYTLSWRYVNSSTSNTYTMALIVNGVTVNSAQPFAKTANSTTFAVSTATVSLNAGNNTIRLQSVASNATADIDWIEITGNAPAAANCAAARPAAIPLTKTTIIYPNPAKDVAKIIVVAEKDEKIAIKVYDTYGRMIDDLGLTKTSGRQQILYNLYNKKPGIYTVVVKSTKGSNSTHKLIVE
ncbi:MAG: InlB B-repeat-containing protein [Bacteroidota bacterium]